MESAASIICALLPRGRLVKRHHLHLEDFEALYVEQGATKLWTRAIVRPKEEIFLPEACGGDKCRGVAWWKESVVMKVIDVFMENEVDVLARMQHILDNMPSGSCFSCEQTAREQLRKLRAELWRQLPQLFHLPPFSDLDEENMR